MHKGDSHETKVWVNEVEHPSLSTTKDKHGGNSNPFLLPNFNSVWVGWQEYQSSSQTFDLWVDEIAIDSKRIGCTK
jgi:hypothetical protein